MKATIVLLILLAASRPTWTTAADSPLPDCPESIGWSEPRDELGGIYAGFTSDLSSVLLLNILAVNGSIQGSYVQTSISDSGIIDQVTFSVTGLYDATDISLSFDLGSETLTAIGIWDPSVIAADFAASGYGLQGVVFIPTKEEIGDSLMASLLDTSTRQLANADILAALTAAASFPPYDVDRSELPSISGLGLAAMDTNVPEMDPIGLLTLGWLGSGEFSNHFLSAPETLSSFYKLHLTATAEDAQILAGCMQAFLYPGGELSVTKNVPNADVYFVNRFDGMSQVLLVSGNAVVSVTVYGSSEVLDAAPGLAFLIEGNLPTQ